MEKSIVRFKTDFEQDFLIKFNRKITKKEYTDIQLYFSDHHEEIKGFDTDELFIEHILNKLAKKMNFKYCFFSFEVDNTIYI